MSVTPFTFMDDPRFEPRPIPEPDPQPFPSNDYTGPVSIVCVLRESKLFNAVDVNRLYRGARRWIRRPFNFYCLTDSKNYEVFEPAVERIALKHPEWMTKHTKLEMFRPELMELFGRTLFLDLDTVICGDIEGILSYSGQFMYLWDFYDTAAAGTGLMSWSPELGPHIYESFTRFPYEYWQPQYSVGGGRGDQLFIRHYIRVVPHYYQQFYPGQVVSFKCHCANQQRPTEARIVCFHGRPKLREITDQWILDAWRTE